MFEYRQTNPRAQKQNLYARLLAARDTASAMVLALSEKPVDHRREVDVQDSLFIIRDCIIPRIQKVLTRAERDRRLGTRRWLPHSSNAVLEDKYKSQVAHIELMVYLIKNRGSFGPTFWSSIVRWQIETYRRFCEKLLREYREATCDMMNDRDGVEAFIAALEKAVKRAHALPDPDPEKAQFSDAFSIRNTYEDPDVKALVDSDRFTPGKRLELQSAVQDLLLQQPMFPPECYAIQRA
ncbi:hypothetical protein FRC01_001054 [Tulasnella sp. 417]|nr:hypothetical protein FRC01_001054 [Tulasnella sp. 417]